MYQKPERQGQFPQSITYGAGRAAMAKAGREAALKATLVMEDIINVGLLELTIEELMIFNTVNSPITPFFSHQYFTSCAARFVFRPQPVDVIGRGPTACLGKLCERSEHWFGLHIWPICSYNSYIYTIMIIHCVCNKNSLFVIRSQ